MTKELVRDVVATHDARTRQDARGKSYVAVIGIDRDRNWQRLDNAAC